VAFTGEGGDSGGVSFGNRTARVVVWAVIEISGDDDEGNASVKHQSASSEAAVRV